MPTLTPNYRVVLPGLADIYHPIPDAARDPEELRTRKREQAERIATSPTPEVARAIQSIMTSIDDVQDALVTLSLASRMLVPSIGALAPAARILATAADIMNIAQFSRTLGLIGGENKGSLYRTLSATPNTYSARLRTTLRTGKINPTVGELLQVLQTSDAFFGAGMSLGAVMGVPTDLAFLAARGGTLQIPADSLLAFITLAPSFAAANPWLKLAGLAGGFALSYLGDLGMQPISIPIPPISNVLEDAASWLSNIVPGVSSFSLVETAESILESTPLLDMLSADLTIEEHFAITTARYLALATIAPFALASPSGILLPEKIPLPVRAKWPSSVATLRALETYPPGVPRSPALPIPGSPVEIRAGDVAQALRQAGAPGPLAWIYEDPDDPRSLAAGLLAREATATLALCLEGQAAFDGFTWTPLAIRAAKTIELGRDPEQPQTHKP